MRNSMKVSGSILIIVMCLSTLGLSSEEFNRGLGFTAGTISGIGATYRHYFDDQGVQFTLGILSNADNVPKFPADYSGGFLTKNGWDIDGWLSFMYLRTLRESEFTKFYYFVGASYEIDYTKKYTQEYAAGGQVGSPVKKIRNDNSYYFGPGIGLDFQLSKYISLIVELPLSISSKMKIITYIPQGGIIVKF